MGALNGIRIVGFTHYAAGPYCLSMMGDHGADAINVEPLKGEEFRARDGHFPGGESSYFLGINRSKRSIAVDINHAEGREVARRLVLSADIVISNYRRGTLERAGLGYEDLRRLNSRLIYCSVTAFGSSGPIAHLPGMDLLAQARSGLMGITGHPDVGPVKVGAPISDYIASYLAMSGILMALREREKSGEGQLVEICLLDGVIASLANLIPLWQKTGQPTGPTGHEHPQLAPYGRYATSDSYIIVGAASPKFWKSLCEALNRVDLSTDSRFQSLQDRLENRKVLDVELSGIFQQKPVAYWLDKLQAAGIPCAPVNTLGDALQDPQVAHNEMVVTSQHSIAGEVLIPGIPVRLSRTPGKIRRPAANLGQHTVEILEAIGYARSEIEILKQTGAIGCN